MDRTRTGRVGRLCRFEAGAQTPLVGLAKSRENVDVFNFFKRRQPELEAEDLAPRAALPPRVAPVAEPALPKAPLVATPQSVASPSRPAGTRFAEDTQIMGDIVSGSRVEIAGAITGNIRASGPVVIAREGIVDGKIDGGDVEIAGRVTGDVTVRQKLTVFGSGCVHGDVSSRSLRIDEGGELQGRCSMGAPPSTMSIGSSRAVSIPEPPPFGVGSKPP